MTINNINLNNNKNNVNNENTYNSSIKTHYFNGLVKATIRRVAYAQSAWSAGMAGHDGWWKYKHVNKTQRLWELGEDYDDIILAMEKKGARSLYQSLNYFSDRYKRNWINSKEYKHIKHADGFMRLEETDYYMLFTDIDLKHNYTVDDPTAKAALETCATYLVKALNSAGIEESVYVCFSGNGAYIIVHPEMLIGYFETLNAGNKEALLLAFNKWLSGIVKTFFEENSWCKRYVKVDELNNVKRQVKTIFSMHKKYNYAVIPADIVDGEVKIKLEDASLPLDDEVIKKVHDSYFKKFNAEERKALLKALEPYIEYKEPKGNYKKREYNACFTDFKINELCPFMQRVFNGEFAYDKGGSRASQYVYAYTKCTKGEEEAIKTHREYCESFNIPVSNTTDLKKNAIVPDCRTVNKNEGVFPKFTMGEVHDCESCKDELCKFVNNPLQYQHIKQGARFVVNDINISGSLYGEFRWKGNKVTIRDENGNDIFNFKLNETLKHKKEIADKFGIEVKLVEEYLKKKVELVKEFKDHYKPLKPFALKGHAGLVYLKRKNRLLYRSMTDPDWSILYSAGKYDIDEKGNEVYQCVLNINGEVKVVNYTSREYKIDGLTILLPEPYNVAHDYSPVDRSMFYQVFEDLKQSLRERVYFKNEYDYDFHALDLIKTYFVHAFPFTNFIKVSGMHGSGKGCLCEYYFDLGLNTLRGDSVTSSVIARALDEENTTLIIDEFERKSMNKDRYEEIIAILRGAYKRSGQSHRAKQGKDKGIVSFDTYGAVVLSSIGAIDAVLGSRCVETYIERKRGFVSRKEPDAVQLLIKYYLENIRLQDFFAIENEYKKIAEKISNVFNNGKKKNIYNVLKNNSTCNNMQKYAINMYIYEEEEEGGNSMYAQMHEKGSSILKKALTKFSGRVMEMFLPHLVLLRHYPGKEREQIASAVFAKCNEYIKKQISDEEELLESQVLYFLLSEMEKQKEITIGSLTDEFNMSYYGENKEYYFYPTAFSKKIKKVIGLETERRGGKSWLVFNEQTKEAIMSKANERGIVFGEEPFTNKDLLNKDEIESLINFMFRTPQNSACMLTDTGLMHNLCIPSKTIAGKSDISINKQNEHSPLKPAAENTKNDSMQNKGVKVEPIVESANNIHTITKESLLERILGIVKDSWSGTSDELMKALKLEGRRAQLTQKLKSLKRVLKENGVKMTYEYNDELNVVFSFKAVPVVNNNVREKLLELLKEKHEINRVSLAIYLKAPFKQVLKELEREGKIKIEGNIISLCEVANNEEQEVLQELKSKQQAGHKVTHIDDIALVTKVNKEKVRRILEQHGVYVSKLGVVKFSCSDSHNRNDSYKLPFNITQYCSQEFYEECLTKAGFSEEEAEQIIKEAVDSGKVEEVGDGVFMLKAIGGENVE